jgi:microcystin-dependent protein
MADLIVKPAYKFGPKDILDADKLNLLATPVVELALTDPVNDQNFFRNGNFYSSFWKTPGGVSCPTGVWTTNASYWLCRPNGAACNFLRSSTVPDKFSLFTAEIQGAASVAIVELGQQINGDLSATLRRKCTFSGYLYNSTGLTISPTLNFYTCDVFNNFAAITLQTTINLQTGANATWTYMTATLDVSTLANAANGLLIAIALPAGSLNAAANNVLFSRLKFQIGEVATEFVDDPSLFITAPSVDSTMLQDGCIARPSLFLPNVVPTGAYQAGSIKSGDIADGQVMAADLDSGTVLTTTAVNFTVPAVNANVNVTVTSAASISSGSILNIQGAGYYQTVSVAGNVVTTKNLGYPNNAASGTVISSGANVNTQNAVIGALGFIPVNKVGDTGIGKLDITVETVVGSGSPGASGLIIDSTETNKANAGYFPSIGFRRGTSGVSRAVGLDVSGKLKTVDGAGVAGFLLDSVHQVDTNSYQDGSITLQKLATSLVNLLIAPGIVQAFAGPSPPAGWLICDGTSYLTSAYPALFNAIGTYWGNGGDVSGAHFQVPDFRGRTPIGYVNSAAPGITARTFGSRGGNETHTLIVAEMPNHSHVVDDPQHTHTSNVHHHSYVNPLGSAMSTASGGQTTYQPGGTTNTSDTADSMLPANTNIVLQSTGGNAPHDIMQPFGVLYFIIKT